MRRSPARSPARPAPRLLAALAALAALALAAGACKAGGTYESGARSGGADRGETNGRMFDLISNKPDGDDWQVRIRDSSMWVAYASGSDQKELGTVNLTGKETNKIWSIIDEIDLGGRDKGEPDEDAGYLQLRLREPGGEEDQHELIMVYVTRDTDEESIVELGTYLQGLIRKYHKQEVEF